MALHRDALMNTGDFQAILGAKNFINTISLKNLITEAPLLVPIINGVNIIQLNHSIFRPTVDNLITGLKTFIVTPSILQFNVEGTINDVASDDLALINSTRLIPPTMLFTNIFIEEQLVIYGQLNYIPFVDFLQNRIRQYGPPQDLTGFLTFQDLILKGNARLPMINDILLDDIVLQTSDSLQEITGHKRIYGNVTLDGPAVITFINSIDIADRYMNSILLDSNMVIKRLEIYDVVDLRNGLKVLQFLNGVDVPMLIDWRPPSATDLQPLRSDIVSAMQSAQGALQHDALKRRKILYLDYAPNIRIKFEAKTNAVTSFTVDTEIPCYHCTCSAQLDVSITLNYQIYVNRRPNFERIIQLNGNNCNVTIYTRFSSQCNELFELNSNTSTIEYLSHRIREPKNFTWFDGLLKSAKLFEQDDISLLLLQSQNGSINVLKLDNIANNWLIISNFNGHQYHHMETLSWDNYNILMLFSAATKKYANGLAQMHYFDGIDFRSINGEIPGNYDRCSSIFMRDRHEFMILLSKTGTDVITVFKAIYHRKMLQKFAFLQKIVLAGGMIEAMVPLSIDDFNYMTVVTQNDYLYLYKYNYLEGWIPVTFGYFKDIETVVPFQYYGREYLYVSMKATATALVVYHQGV